ncbi:MAG: AAA family ATPase [Myxococcales bacterium]|nr:AAA family ATPase [Myxococcales bacterium]
MTVIVGPNNSGKSLSLRELNKSLTHGRHDWSEDKWKVIGDIEPELPSSGAVRTAIENELEKDFAPFNSLELKDDGLAFLFSLVTSNQNFGDLPPLLMEAVKHLLVLLAKRKVAENLEREGKLYPLASKAVENLPEITVKPDNLDDLIRQKLDEVVEMIKNSHEGLLNLLSSVRGQSPAVLAQGGFVNLRGYFNHIQGTVAFLDGKTRLSLINPESTASMRRRNVDGGTLMRLRNDRAQMNRLRSYVFDAFGLHAALDILEMSQIKLVLSQLPLPDGIEDHLDDEARTFFAAATDLGEFSDGVRTYIGLHAHLLSQDCRYAMIDEPEAFLHPPLARRLGANLTSLAAERGTYVFAATHSPEFLMGCLSTGHPVNVVRLGYKNGQGSARVLDPERLKEIMQDPLLRSSGTLSALFHEAVVICEGASDRAFYSEINNRLIRHERDYPRRMQSSLFIDVIGKASISRAVDGLKHMGVPVASIIDLDILKDTKVLNKILMAIGLHKTEADSLSNMRGNVMMLFTDRKDLLKKGGVQALAKPDERAAVQRFIDNMGDTGIFVPAGGELETWLIDLGVSDVDKSDWPAAIFEKMGTMDEGVKPAAGDVWAFMRTIARWLDQPAK